MYQLPEPMMTRLIKLNQKLLNKGELFLLAKAISDVLPLAPIDLENIKIHNLSHREMINRVLYTISDYSYLDNAAFETLYRLIDELSLWRFNVAYQPPMITFSGSPEQVVDELSAMTRYIDSTFLAAVSDIATNATYMYRLFREIADEFRVYGLQQQVGG